MAEDRAAGEAPAQSAAQSVTQSAAPAAAQSAAPAAAQAIAQRSADLMYAADLASRQAGIEVHEVAPGRASARMQVGPAMINGHDICHGGYVFMLADTAFAFACNTYGTPTVAQACDIIFIRPARAGDELVAVAAERGRYGRTGVYDVTVRRGDGEVVAEFRGRSRTLTGPDGTDGEKRKEQS